MAKAKKKAGKKPARVAPKKKTVAKPKPAAARSAKSAPPTVKKSSGGGVQLGVSLELDTRLRELATHMNKSLAEVLIQALTEFADNWEDHLRTVKSLNAGDDRMQLSVPDDDNGP